jgi:hypothetical protein
VVDCVQRLTELSRDYAFSPGDVIAFATALDSPSSPRQKLKSADVYSISTTNGIDLGFQLRK